MNLETYKLKDICWASNAFYFFLLRTHSHRETALHWLSYWYLKGVHWFQLQHLHQAPSSASTLASKFNWVLVRSKGGNASFNIDARCEHSLNSSPLPIIRAPYFTLLNWLKTSETSTRGRKQLQVVKRNVMHTYISKL